jgi:hypothetical protein
LGGLLLRHAPESSRHLCAFSSGKYSFSATDLVKVENGRITDNWHIEDNLTLLHQMGVAKVAS